MATVLEDYTIEDQRSVVRFFMGKRLNAKDIHKEMFPVYGAKCLSRKAFNKRGREILSRTFEIRR
jgi:hypothetical protein